MDTPVKSSVLGIQVMLHSEGGGGTDIAIEKKCIGFVGNWWIRFKTIRDGIIIGCITKFMTELKLPGSICDGYVNTCCITYYCQPLKGLLEIVLIDFVFNWLGSYFFMVTINRIQHWHDLHGFVLYPQLKPFRDTLGWGENKLGLEKNWLFQNICKVNTNTQQKYVTSRRQFVLCHIYTKCSSKYTEGKWISF